MRIGFMAWAPKPVMPISLHPLAVESTPQLPSPFLTDSQFGTTATANETDHVRSPFRVHGSPVGSDAVGGHERRQERSGRRGGTAQLADMKRPCFELGCVREVG